MSALVELALGLFALTVVAAIFYPIILVLFIVNRKLTALLLPKVSIEVRNRQDTEPPFSVKYPNGSR